MYVNRMPRDLSHTIVDQKRLFTCPHGSQTYTVLSLKNELFTTYTLSSLVRTSVSFVL